MIATIVVGYDEGEPSRRALERAAMLAKPFSATVVVASVAPVTTPAAGRSIGADPTDTAAEHLVELAHARTYLEREGVKAEYVEAVGHEADAILAVARQRSADLIVVGARHLPTLARLFGQSVSDSVSHGAECDVLIVH